MVDPEHWASTRDRRPDGAMLSIVVMWGLGPPVTKLITAPVLVGVSVRFWLSVPILWILTYACGRRVSRTLLAKTAIPGAVFGINLLCVFAALQHTSVAVLAMVQALQPAVVFVVAGCWLDEAVTKRQIIWTLVGMIGVAIVVLGGDPSLAGDHLGILLSVAAMLTFVTYHLVTRFARSTTDVSALEWMAGVSVFAAATVTPFAVVASAGDFHQLGGLDWIYMAYVVGAVGIAGHTLMSWTHRFLDASRSSLYLLSMNPVAVAAAWPMHHERITLSQAAGMLLVLLGVGAVITHATERSPGSSLETH